VGKELLGPSYFFISLVLVPLNSPLWWEVPLAVSALRRKEGHSKMPVWTQLICDLLSPDLEDT
jgi:hypothetical protein